VRGESRCMLGRRIRRMVLRCGLTLFRSLELEAVVGVCMGEDPCLENCWSRRDKIRLGLS
jgi:hypothetical protein